MIFEFAVNHVIVIVLCTPPEFRRSFRTILDGVKSGLLLHIVCKKFIYLPERKILFTSSFVKNVGTIDSL